MYETINNFLHQFLAPTCQSIQSYIQLLENPSFNISKETTIKILKNCLKRFGELRQELLSSINEEVKE
jgi:hypothetical protein